MGYMGSEEFIRLQFEEYLLALLSSVKYHQYLYSPNRDSILSDIDGDPSLDFNSDWVEAWQATSNYALFNKYTDSHLFDIVEPKHPTAGGLSMDDINRRLAQQIQELHLDERLATSREALNKHLATGQKKVSTAFNNLWADIEAMREAQRQRQLEAAQIRASSPSPPLSNALPSPSIFATPLSSPSSENHKYPVPPRTPTPRFDTAALRARAPDLSHAHASVSAAGQKAGAYISSWGTWASEKRKGWGTKGSSSGNGEGSSGGSGGGGVEKVEGLEGRMSPRRKRGSREERGGDGIGRLDA